MDRGDLMLLLQVKGAYSSEYFTGLFAVIGIGIVSLWAAAIVVKKVVQSWSADQMRTDQSKNVFITYAKEVAAASVKEHDEAANAHGIYRRQAEVTWRAELGEVFVEHEKDPTAHHGYALQPYARREELKNAVDTISLTLGAFKDSVIAMQSGLKDQLNEQKEQLAKIEQLVRENARAK